MTEEEVIDCIVIAQLKETLVNTYLTKPQHYDDIIHNLRVRRGCKSLLRHYMIPRLAEKYIAIIEYLHEGIKHDQAN